MRAVTAASVAAGIIGAGYAIGVGRATADGRPLGPGPVTVVLDIEHSTFSPASLRVVKGTQVRFVVDNHDPINHELIVGTPEVHRRHSSGTEPHHATVPGEVSVSPGKRVSTTYTFDAVGQVELACHLPGHYDYGMRGSVSVIP